MNKNDEEAKKYGLVWKDYPEEVEEKCQSQLPIFKEVKGKELKRKDTGPDSVSLFEYIDKEAFSPTHLLIEGDNYHALAALNYTHREKIDVICIDPPYNTGNKDFMYNDRMVGEDDSYRHSKWLSFMSKRLKLAKNLLKDTGSIFIQIGDGEFAQLKLLCDQIFGEQNFINNIIWHYRRWSGAPKHFQKMHDNILWYSKSDKYLFNRLLQEYSDPRWIEDTVRGVVDGKLVRLKDENGDYIKREKPNEGVLMHDVWEDINFLSPTSPERTGFNTQKPVALIKRILLSTTTRDSIVLDFFAGSGTTGHAVLELNKEDGGNRQFILCTNNENNICTEVCYPRITKAMQGYKTPKGKKVEGLGGSLKYFKTGFVKKVRDIEQMTSDIMDKCTERTNI